MATLWDDIKPSDQSNSGYYYSLLANKNAFEQLKAVGDYFTEKKTATDNIAMTGKREKYKQELLDRLKIKERQEAVAASPANQKPLLPIVDQSSNNNETSLTST